MVCLGIDTSNYTTSASLYFAQTNEVVQLKKLLPVKSGQQGLRQSDAVFHHTVQLPEIISNIFEKCPVKIDRVGVSTRPRDVDGSYMPCFLVGMSVAKALSCAQSIPLKTFSHQSGHIAAALYSANKMHLMNEKFIAFHVSGGTTEVLLVEPSNDKSEKPFNIELIATSLDLKAGQAIDRVGVMLGLDFPAGAKMDEISRNCTNNHKIKPVLKGMDCCLSGLENQCKKLYESGESAEKVARYCIEYILLTLEYVIEKLIEKYGNLPLVFSGGVMSNTLIKETITNKYGGFFAEPVFSADNAAGISVLTSL